MQYEFHVKSGFSFAPLADNLYFCTPKGILVAFGIAFSGQSIKDF
jgi:hypothetical protein